MKRKIALLTTLLWLVTVALVHAQGLPAAKPEQVGLSSERLNALVGTLRADAEKGRIPGAVLLVARHGKVALFEPVGVLDPAKKNAMTRDAIFRIYSMTKPIASVAAMILVEEGKLALGDPVAKYIPQIAEMKVGVEKPGADGKPTLELVPPRRQMTVQDLLRHTSGVTYGIFGNTLVKKQWLEAKPFAGDPTNAEFVDRLVKLPLANHPGAVWDYSHSTDVLGRVVEIVTGKPLYAFMKERILDPLGMKDTAFDVTDAAKQVRIAEPFPNDVTIGTDTTFFDPRQPQRWQSGGGGMVGTTMDYARFCQMLLNGGVLDGKRILSPKTVAYMAADHLDASVAPGPLYLPGPGFGFGLGFAVRKDAGVASVQGSVGEYNWGGAGGTYFWIDPKEDLFVVFAMQAPKERAYYRPVLKNMIYGAVVKPGGR
jgi:CubicO group peptidase (beta-lactamase class C family)